MLISHSVLYIVARIGAGVISIATTALLTRLLDPTRYGVYGVILAIMTFGSAIVFDWQGITVIRFVQSRRDDPAVRTTVVIIYLLLLAFIASLGEAAYLVGLVPPHAGGLVAAGIFVVGTYAWCEIAAQFEVANLRPTRYLTIYSARSVLTFTGAVGAAWVTRDPLMVALGSGTGMVLATSFGTLIRVRLRFSLFDRALARQMLNFGAPLALSLSFSSMNLAGSRFILASLGSIDGLGYFTAASNLVIVTLSVITGGLESATYSFAVKTMETGDRAATRAQLAQNFTLILAVLAPTAIGMALTAQGIAHTLVGHRFSAVVATLIPVLALGSLFGCIRTSYLDKAFQLGNKPSKQIAVMATAAFVSICGSWFLVPIYGPLGAAVAVVSAQLISCVHCRWAARDAYPLPLPFAAIWRVGASCAVMALIVKSVPGTGAVLLAAQVVLGGGSYCLMALASNLLEIRTKILRRLSRRPS